MAQDFGVENLKIYIYFNTLPQIDTTGRKELGNWNFEHRLEQSDIYWWIIVLVDKQWLARLCTRKRSMFVDSTALFTGNLNAARTVQFCRPTLLPSANKYRWWQFEMDVILEYNKRKHKSHVWPLVWQYLDKVVARFQSDRKFLVHHQGYTTS